MSKIIETTIDRFGSMTPRLRENSYNFALAVHFNIFRSGTLLPNVSYTAFTDASEKVVKFLYANGYDNGAVQYLYGLGDSGAAPFYPKIFRTTVSITPSWTAVTNGLGDIGVLNTKVFFEYKNYLYGWQSTNKLWQLGDISSTASPTMTQAYKTIAFTNVAQPVHHKADDIAYFFNDNIVHKLNGTTWDNGAGDVTAGILTLPSNMKIIGGASYGNYLNIVCSPLFLGMTNSVMYLWDRDASLATLTQKIDLGMGEAVHVSEAEDGGCWITQRARTAGGVASRNNFISVKYFNGYLLNLEIPFGMPTDYFADITLVGNAWEERGVFYFPATIELQATGETRYVIFAARKNGGQIELIIDQELEDATAAINGIFSLAGIWYVSHNATPLCSMAKISSAYGTGIYESKIFAGDASLKKKLIGVSVMTSALPASATVVLKYRKDNEIIDDASSWTTIFTNSPTTAGSFISGKEYRIVSVGTTDFTLIGASANTVGLIFIATGAGTGTGTAQDDLVSHSAINIESSGAALPEYKEIQFRLESTGGAEITAFSFMEEITGKRLYMAIWEAIVNFGKSLIR